MKREGWCGGLGDLVVKIPFTKMHGLGNDYIYIDGFKTPAETLPDPAALAVRLSPRRFSVGADGLVLILPSKVAHARMHMFNADGSEGLMCGNAIRCVGKYLYERGLVSPDTRALTVETAAGIKTLALTVEAGEVIRVTVDMGEAFVSDGEDVVLAAGKEYRLIPVSVGNPHGVIFVEATTEEEIFAVGPTLSESRPGGINVELAEVLDATHVRMRVYERGSGVTLACGTGACAVVAAAVARGLCPADTPVTVSLYGGDLTVTSASDGRLFMAGPAAFAYDGVAEITV